MPIVGSNITVVLTTHGTTYSLLASNVANLTTVFTPPASCATPCYFLGDSNRSDVALLGTACRYVGNDHTACQPGSYDDSEIVFPYYSPGICPQGFTRACSPISEISFRENATAQVCCPTGYQCNHYDYQGDYSAQCFSYVPVSSYITPIFLSANVTGSGGLPVYTSLSASAVDYIATVAYAGVTVAWEATDTAIVDLLASSSSVLSTAGSSTEAPSSTSSLLANSSSSIASQATTSRLGQPGLSAGAWGGVGVGIAVAVSLAAGGTILYIRRLKSALIASRVEPEYLKPELPATEKGRQIPVEVDVTPYVAHELMVNEPPVELDVHERREHDH
ncbi:hypothetical protein BDV96DRAFT_673990 [Lophiotrema nucula]|uniref:Uncharacterized protein n=1 Tax=Lophiotrema nucula TaxID=690887 RepID=A0A6A5ZLW7_9PLEO|nr:hypothetical protein BDV96DRAFT_673990 [Lophiotrema nucula]